AAKGCVIYLPGIDNPMVISQGEPIRFERTFSERNGWNTFNIGRYNITLMPLSGRWQKKILADEGYHGKFRVSRPHQEEALKKLDALIEAGRNDESVRKTVYNVRVTEIEYAKDSGRFIGLRVIATLPDPGTEISGTGISGTEISGFVPYTEIPRILMHSIEDDIQRSDRLLPAVFIDYFKRNGRAKEPNFSIKKGYAQEYRKAFKDLADAHETYNEIDPLSLKVRVFPNSVSSNNTGLNLYFGPVRVFLNWHEIDEELIYEYGTPETKDETLAAIAENVKSLFIYVNNIDDSKPDRPPFITVTMFPPSNTQKQLSGDEPPYTDGKPNKKRKRTKDEQRRDKAIRRGDLDHRAVQKFLGRSP
ncbi:MAG: hypothetical protein ABII23_07380, partial [bacterium]